MIVTSFIGLITGHTGLTITYRLYIQTDDTLPHIILASLTPSGSRPVAQSGCHHLIVSNILQVDTFCALNELSKG